MKYTLEELFDKFQGHTILAERQRKEWIASFKENNPTEPLPEHMMEDFNLPLALSCLCEEILDIKSKIR